MNFHVHNDEVMSASRDCGSCGSCGVPPPLVYINRAGRTQLVDDVTFVRHSRAHVARLRRGMDWSVNQS